MDIRKRRVSAILDAEEVSLATHLTQYLRAADDSDLEELLDRLRVRANELQEEHRADPGNQAVAAELAWILCVNHEVGRRRRIFEAFEAQFGVAL